MKKLVRSAGLSLLFGVSVLFGVMENVEACSDVMLNSRNYVISGRNMDLSTDIRSEAVVVPAGHTVRVKNAEGDVTAIWRSAYGFVGINALHTDRYNDGLNEKGLSAATQTLSSSVYPSEAEYPGYACIPINHAVEWILGNFSTVGEVEQALRHTIITSDNVPSRKRHLVIHDAAGRSMVVEFIGGKMNIYDSSDIQVLTNDPDYAWQIENLKRYTGYTSKIPYANLKNIPERKNGMPDLPGNASPASRFVRAYFLNKFTAEPVNLQEAVEETDAIMGRLAILRGELIIKGREEITWWTVIRDHQNRVLYFKDVNNSALRSIDLKKLNLTDGAPILRMPLAEQETIPSAESLLQPGRSK